jgi:tetratricopeptide (TPR) repeat protein
MAKSPTLRFACLSKYCTILLLISWLCLPHLSVGQTIVKRTVLSQEQSEELTRAQAEAKALTLQALTYEKLGKTREAIARYDEVVERFASSLAKADTWQFAHPYAVNLLYRAELLTKLKQPEKAMASYRMVIKLFKNFDHLTLTESVTDAVLGIAELMASMGKTVEARAGFKEVEERVGTSIAVIDVHRLVKAQRYLAIPQADTWSGTYRMEPGSKDNAKEIPTAIYKISKQPDLIEKNVASRYASDLARWLMYVEADQARQSTKIRRFLLNDDLNEYEGFGWTQLYLQNKIECMDAGHFFFCRAEPNSIIRFNKDESYTTKTGIFGIMRRAGVFELVKVD